MSALIGIILLAALVAVLVGIGGYCLYLVLRSVKDHNGIPPGG